MARSKASSRITIWSVAITFRTLRIRLLAGRTFRDDDGREPWTAAIVNEEFARRFGFGQDVVGKQTSEPGHPLTIIGMGATSAHKVSKVHPFQRFIYRRCGF